MKIKFHGAASGEVTGSAYLVQTKRARVLVDCGMFQGGREAAARNRPPEAARRGKLDAVLITHGHLDHTGRLPLIARLGYTGPVYATPATLEMAGLILRDSARLQLQDSERQNRRLERAGKPLMEPLYTPEDAEAIIRQFKAVPYQKAVTVAPGVRATWAEAGHMLGSASIMLSVEEDGRTKHVVFSGDLGPKGTPILRDSEPFQHADMVVMESTYGDHDHRPFKETVTEFVDIVKDAVEHHGKVLVPTFAVGRAQLLTLLLSWMFRKGKVKPFPIFLDSPMAIEATRIYARHIELFDDDMVNYMREKRLREDLKLMKATETADASRAINGCPGPCLIMAGAGMCNAGRILHHLKQNLWKPETHVLIVGYPRSTPTAAVSTRSRTAAASCTATSAALKAARPSRPRPSRKRTFSTSCRTTTWSSSTRNVRSPFARWLNLRELQQAEKHLGMHCRVVWTSIHDRMSVSGPGTERHVGRTRTKSKEQTSMDMRASACMRVASPVRPLDQFRSASSLRRRAIGTMLLLAAAGCSQTMPDRAERMTRGYMYYFDGAGGGGLINWAGGVKQGLLDAGYSGAGEVFKWNTGLGVVPDQDSSVEYKRSKAAEAARSIQQYVKEHPGAPVTLMGLSAGTAVTVFALEALPVSCPVDHVVLLGASISSDYDLTQALRRVRNRMYVFTSERDAVLAFAVTIAGTADRRVGSTSAGLHGFEMPSRVSAETRTQYAKVVNIRWKSEFIAAGNVGRHTDAVKAPFVQQYIAPLIMAGMARQVSQPILFAKAKVRNPDYSRWAAYNPGAWVTFEGYQLVSGVRQKMRMKAQLVSKHEDRLLVERAYMIGEPGTEQQTRVQQFLVQAQIDPAEHPLTSPAARIAEGPAETLTINGKAMAAHVRTVQANGDFPEYGRDVWAVVGQNDAVPGGMLKVHLKSSKNGQPYEVRGQVVAFGTGPR